MLSRCEGQRVCIEIRDVVSVERGISVDSAKMSQLVPVAKVNLLTFTVSPPFAIRAAFSILQF
jgi:hypothetical protein